MVDIRDQNRYISSMAKTLYDKCWWIDKIPDDVFDVVDFGCAQGDLAVMINRIAPDRFRYLGVDSSPEMIALANHNFSLHFQNSSTALLYANMQDAIREIDTSKSVLVLNSVLHEIFSYLTKAEQSALLDLLFNSGFKYIAIRDMHMPRYVDLMVFSNDDIANILNGRYADQWREFEKICERRGREFCSKEI